ncbi:MAG: HAMP domain-containing histidine kinase [Anaerolineales bacterium]|nr:HAMP domain-containing histidine kinase [Anaerolineales bacterium]MCA9929004.1 HAMP domain-containing histidine kinase [Anaerolineales bacterium]
MGWKQGPPPFRKQHFRGRHEWRKHRPRFLFVRMALIFGGMVGLVVGGMAALAFVITRLFEGDGKTAVFVWMGGCGLAFALPALASMVARRAWRGIATPLADVMAAADAVADGDLSARVPEQRPGEFGSLARSFNHMAAELERSDQQRRNLTADVAHELRTPLHIIQGNLEGILDGVYEPTPDHITDTLEETQLLARLVDDLRTLSLAEAGQLPMRSEPVDVAELLADVQTSFSGQAEAAGVGLRIAIKDNRPLLVQGDADRLDQVLSNLVANGLRYTPTGGVITLTAVSQNDGIQIQVADTGSGIAPDDLPFIFDRFWRGDKARTHHDGSGSGLGLAIAKQLVVGQNGRIAVTSIPGEGTTFTITLKKNNE